MTYHRVRARALFTVALTAGSLAPGCRSEQSAGSEGASAPSAAAAPSASAVSPASPGASQATPGAAPWYAGKWSSKLTTQVHRIEMTKREGAVVEWSKDDGKRGVGDVSLELTVDAAGEVMGGGQGALGPLLAVGSVQGEELRVQLSNPAAEASQAFSGLVLATRAGEVLKGKLQVSTGDSLVVRSAELTLEKAKDGAGAPSGAR